MSKDPEKGGRMEFMENNENQSCLLYTSDAADEL